MFETMSGSALFAGTIGNFVVHLALRRLSDENSFALN
jgi:hypothetical protein